MMLDYEGRAQKLVLYVKANSGFLLSYASRELHLARE